MNSPITTATLLIVCPDQPGLVAKVSHFVHQHHGNILDLDQHTDAETSTFLMRIEWDLQGFQLGRTELKEQFSNLAIQCRMQFSLHFSDEKVRVAIFVSKYRHCLYDLLVRHALGELDVEIPLILSNHPDLKEVADHFSIPYRCIPVSPHNKPQAEQVALDLLKQHRINLVVLARYMQVLSKSFVMAYPNSIINIHHSFLPAFKGSRPYHQAYSRGVKVIGATSHYVTENLDEGPIIEQSVTRISHRDHVEDLIRKGRDQEKSALAFAVRMHAKHRILTYGNKTIVFE